MELSSTLQNRKMEGKSKPKIIITGVNGFLGKHLYNSLSKKYNIAPISIRLNSDWDLIKSEIIDFKPDIFIHCGWSYGNSFYDINENQYDNVKIGIKLMKILSNIDNLYFMGVGSFAEYGFNNNIITELDKEMPNNDYGLAKNFFKSISEKFCHINNFKWTWIRPCYIFGPNDVQTRLIPKVINLCLKNKDIELNSCDSVIDYLYIKDFTRAINRLISNQESGIFNICSGNQYEIKNIIETIKHLCGSKSQISFNSSIDRKNFPKYICGNNTKLKSTSWFPKYNLIEGLTETIKFYDKK
tara:strand:- start:732 stop:1628 length:897 start_codon:yes stop_codon:yes gene_type:complete